MRELERLRGVYMSKLPCVAVDVAEAVNMVEGGCNREQVARYFGVGVEALGRACGVELDKAEVSAVLEVARALKGRAVEGDVRAAEAWLMNRGGWVRTPAVMGGGDGVKLAIQINMGGTTADGGA